MTIAADGGTPSMWCPNQECPDALESGSPAEFVQGIIVCPFCGTALISYRPEWVDSGTPEITLVPVLPIVDNSWLPQIKALLDSAGVRFLLSDQGAKNSGVWGGASRFDPTAGAPVVMVEESDLERATELLQEFREQVGPESRVAPVELTPPALQPTSCSQCGKELEASEGDEPLAYCYHCGAPLGSG